MSHGIGVYSLALVVLAVALGPRRTWAFGEAQKFLLVTAPSTHRVAYLRLPGSGAPQEPGEQMRTLVDSGLHVPQGIAVDQYRKKLYVADPALGKLVGYDLKHNGNALEVGDQFTVADGVEVRWVAVDGLGNVFFTDEPRHRVMRVTAEMIEKGDTAAQVLYDQSTTGKVSAPGGLASDNYFVYWLNKASGTQVGTLMRGTANSHIGANSSIPVTDLTRNAMKCYGVCLALNNIFYTDEQSHLYGVKRTGGLPQTVSTSFQEPRGCAFDGEGTVYVADKAQNAVYQFPSNMPVINPGVPMKKAADLQGAYGLAVYVKVMA